MAKFRIYNIQLLPNDNFPEVGKSGYRKLFANLRESNKFHLQEKSHRNFHHKMAEGSYFGPFEFNFKAGYVWGHFVKYDEADEVTELATGRVIYKSTGKGGAITSRKKALYVFDTERHLLAIDEGRGALPSAVDLIDALNKFFSKIVEDHFHNYTLTVNIISKPGELEKILRNADGYKTVKLNLTYPNGPAQSILQDMKNTKMQTLEMNASGGKGGRMTNLPDFMKEFLRAAQRFGKFRIGYFSKDDTNPMKKSKYHIYDSTSNPLTINMRQTQNDDGDEGFAKRAYHELNELDTSRSE